MKKVGLVKFFIASLLSSAFIFVTLMLASYVYNCYSIKADALASLAAGFISTAWHFREAKHEK